jgi:hypothetical protein
LKHNQTHFFVVVVVVDSQLQSLECLVQHFSAQQMNTACESAILTLLNNQSRPLLREELISSVTAGCRSHSEWNEEIVSHTLDLLINNKKLLVAFNSFF